MSGPGRLFVIDGNVNGCGKTEQAEKRLVPRLNAEGHRAKYIRFPRYGHPSAAEVEAYLRGDFGPADSVDPFRTMKMYAADQEAAAPELNALIEHGWIGVLDRFSSSNVGHQGGKVPDRANRISFINHVLWYTHEKLKVPRPDLTIVLFLPVDLAIERLNEAGGDLNAHERDRRHLVNASQAYLDAVKTYPEQFRLVDCTENGVQMPPERIHEIVWSIIKPRL